jgi:NAD(P)H dehydrogenase (quinone)
MIPGTTLVTGATGATGGETIKLLLRRGDSVRALAHRQDERSKRLQEEGVEVVFGDFLDFDAMRAALKGRVEPTFAIPFVPASFRRPPSSLRLRRRQGSTVS